MINITSFIQELEPIPYKLVRFDDNTYCGPKGNMMSDNKRRGAEIAPAKFGYLYFRGGDHDPEGSVGAARRV